MGKIKTEKGFAKEVEIASAEKHPKRETFKQKSSTQKMFKCLTAESRRQMEVVAECELRQWKYST